MVRNIQINESEKRELLKQHSNNKSFLIEDDGFESLQLKSAGAWFKGKFGEKQVMTLYLTRVGP